MPRHRPWRLVDSYILGLNDIHSTQTPMPFRKLGYRPNVSAVVTEYTINPNSPITDAKISTIKTLTNSVGSAASASAALLPTIPTLTPHAKLHNPTVNPDQNSA